MTLLRTGNGTLPSLEDSARLVVALLLWTLLVALHLVGLGVWGPKVGAAVGRVVWR